MQNVKWGKEIESYQEEPLYIYLYRDPRDVALSFSKAIVGEKHPYAISKRWLAAQKRCLEFGKRIPQNRFLTVSYEELVRSPEKILKTISDRFGLKYSNEMDSNFLASRTILKTHPIHFLFP